MPPQKVRSEFNSDFFFSLTEYQRVKLLGISQVGYAPTADYTFFELVASQHHSKS